MLILLLMGFISWPLLPVSPDLRAHCWSPHSNKQTHAQAHSRLRKCQEWLTSRPRVMFKATHLRLQGIRELIRTGTACPIGFAGLFSASRKASTKAVIYCTLNVLTFRFFPGVCPIIFHLPVPTCFPWFPCPGSCVSPPISSFPVFPADPVVLDFSVFFKVLFFQ